MKSTNYEISLYTFFFPSAVIFSPIDSNNLLAFSSQTPPVRVLLYG
jgi:hypothetical protein